MLLDHISRANNGTNSAAHAPWTFQGAAVGRIAPAALQLAEKHLDPNLDATCIEQVHSLCEAIKTEVAVRWHDEAFGLYTLDTLTEVGTVPRGSVPYLGIQAFGVHANGYVRDGDNLKMWVAKRSADKPTFPGQWDNMVGGGLTAGMTAADVLVKEAFEEAALDMDTAVAVQPTGVLRYCHASDGGLRNNALYLYDIEVPADWTPTPNDGEVERFELWGMDKLRRCIETTRSFKYNCNVVVIDFMLRHGVITPDEPGYADLKRALDERLQPA